MKAIRLVATINKPFEQFQDRLNRVFEKSLASHLLARRWDGQTVTISGAGAHGVGRFEAGLMRVHVRLGFPASMMKERILQDIIWMLKEAGGDPVKVL